MCICAVLSLLFCLAVCDGKPQFRNDYKYQASIDGWMKFHQVPMTWSEARFQCLYEGSVLASPLTNEMHKTMLELIGKSAFPVFTGVSATYSSGVYFSIEGVPLSKMSGYRAPFESNNRGSKNENCIAMYLNGTLEDVDCDEIRPFICYKQETQEMPGINECGTIDSEYVLDNKTDHCYKFHRFGHVWPQAFKVCVAEGGYLAIINSEEEAQVVKELIAKNPDKVIQSYHRAFIGVGFRDWSDKGTMFRTVHGQTLEEAGYARWANGDPSSPGAKADSVLRNEHCGVVVRSAELVDIPCDETVPFICEMEPGTLNNEII